jgi:cellulose synthase/poly-beta-1,6-N-acetylglucosamine synthase-like glycosyltransferase
MALGGSTDYMHPHVVPAEKMTAAAAVAAGAVSAAAAAVILLATQDVDIGNNSSEMICERNLQLLWVMGWVISFAMSALWLLTHGRLQAFLRDPSKWMTWGSGGRIVKARQGSPLLSTPPSSPSLKQIKPMVSVLLPVKGVHERTLMHWQSQVRASHGGPIEFIFCMESEEDPAYRAALDFREQCGESAVIKVISCGLSFYCSQKIHNLLTGLTLINKDSEYVLFLDDDAQMSSAILLDLVHCLEAEPEVLIASGWPNDFIPPDCASTPSFASFMLLGYRCLSHVSMGTLNPTVLWGGCLLLRRAELFDSQIGILEAWRNSGYSDDMILIGRARKAGRSIAIPPSAFLPSRIDHDYSLLRHTNYIRRQMFVLGTYYDTYDRLNNLFLLTIVSFLFLLFGCFNFQLLTIHSVYGLLYILVRDPRMLLPLQLMQRQQCGYLQTSPAALYLLVLAAAALFIYALMRCYRSVVLVTELIARKPSQFSHTLGTLRFGTLLFLGLAAQCLLQSFAAVVAFFSNSIVWSGVRYHKKNGQVSAVYRTSDKDGKLYTIPIQKAREEAHR